MTCRPVSVMIWWQLFIWLVLEILHLTRTFIGLCDMQTCVRYDMMTVVHLIGVGNPSYNQDIYRPVWHADVSVMSVVHLIGVGNPSFNQDIYRPVWHADVSVMTVVHLIGVGNPSYNQDIYRPVWHADVSVMMTVVHLMDELFHGCCRSLI